MWQVLKKKFYPSFIVSDIYHRYIIGSEDGSPSSTSKLAKGTIKVILCMCAYMYFSGIHILAELGLNQVR